MGEAAGPIGSASSMASVGLAAYGSIYKGQGQKAADDFKAAELDRAAEYGKLKATQTGALLTQKLNMTLGNIDAMRAASHTDPTSPSGVAYRDTQEEIGNTQKSITVGNILADARQKKADAEYMRWAGNRALMSGYIGAAGTVLGAVGGAVGQGGGGYSQPADNSAGDFWG